MPILRLLLPSFRHFQSHPTPRFLSLLPHSNNIPAQDKDSLLNYLTDNLKFPKPKAIRILNRSSPLLKTTNPNPHSVVQFLNSLDFSDAQVRAAVSVCPKILFYNVENALKPRIQYFHELGLTGSDLSKFITKNSFYLNDIYFERLVPCVQIIKKVITSDVNNEKLLRTLSRCNWVRVKDPEEKLSANISSLESCGIVGHQLAMIMTRQPRLFIMPNSELVNLVSRVSDMGFSVESRMLVYGLYSVSGMSSSTFAQKIDLLGSFGFSKVECMKMFTKTPALLRSSEGKLKDGIEFFVAKMKFEKSVLVRQPIYLMFSMKERVLPRLRVVHLLKSKNLVKKEPAIDTVLRVSEEEFMDKFVIRFSGSSEELLEAYKVGCKTSFENGSLLSVLH